MSPPNSTETVPAAVDVEGLELVYGDGTAAVDGVDMTVPEGEFFGFLGPNGAGKTTTIKVLSTLLGPTSGTVHVNGFDVRTEPRKIRETIGYMAQETSIDPELTAEENIRFACEAYGVPRGDRDQRVDELLDLVDLADVADKRAEEFSGGMKKRLDAATALVHRPPLVFLDEPTTGLDPKARNRLWDYFRRINDRGTTIFLTTQYLEEADQLCDRLAVILDGQIVADGSPSNLKRRVGGDVLDLELDGGVDVRARAATIAREFEAFPDATVDETDEGITVTAESVRQHGTDLLVALRDAGLTVVGFNIRAPTLDDVFLAITGDTVDAESTDAVEDETPASTASEVSQ
ncbi:ABC-2 type transport system ATP-binding protein [Halohasta litchfieldiae]|jgi:ABC-2 type transport system ATP-binding protein|uniref:ABC-2 type transport system ATP-binding protein n=1 Tax=Halohasta litchfieldiae TaxID=1073996 RepID=A0A1H6S7H5_9EURY|nr:ABC transporter ATP-binding protein [Halohasta litchfieldiae]ATW89319.1 ABC-2 type transport system ATP-binding protein [Halohasta litchfieldiae]SEI59382.1 ABC-2 type transport system ATP-binding protein [Halohasta litchfieldiae]